MARVPEKPSPQRVAFANLRSHPLFAPLLGSAYSAYGHSDAIGKGVAEDGIWGYCGGTGSYGRLHLNHRKDFPRKAPPREQLVGQWEWVIAHLLLHLGMNHHLPATAGPEAGDTSEFDPAYQAACEIAVLRLQQPLKLGTAPFPLPEALPAGDERTLADRFRRGLTPLPDLRYAGGPRGCVARGEHDWSGAFARGLENAVTAAVRVAAGIQPNLTSQTDPTAPWELARRWFIAKFPLLAATMSVLTVEADPEILAAYGISVAAVNPELGRIYVNPNAGLTQDEWRFVLAHEALHAALGHHVRGGGRDLDLFNVACDFVINGWLREMNVGVQPHGSLYDPQFDGMSAESVYDVIAAAHKKYRSDAQRHRDIIRPGDNLGGPRGDFTDLDALLRRGLLAGLDLQIHSGRGLLPAGLIEAIRALDHRPIEWDAAVAEWFSEQFPATTRSRSFARPSRRAASTPDIPRAGWYRPNETAIRRTFAVILDTSGSMSPATLGYALGAISSYAGAHEVPYARVIHCDASPYDRGYQAPSDLHDDVAIHGRGGTRLQPALDLLDAADDFPADGPVLIITDGQIDRLSIAREHAFLVPPGARLPFVPQGPVFYIDG